MSKKKTASCTCCGKTYEKSAGFYQSLSPIYESNDNRMHICKNCVCNIFDKFVDLFGDEEKALYRTTLLLDVYFDESILNMVYATAKKTNSSLVKIYLQKINLSKVSKFKTSFDSKEYTVKDDFMVAKEENKPEKKKKLDSSITAEMIRRWGKGLDDEEYLYLEEKYQELIKVYDHRSPVQKMLYENMAKTQLEAEKSRKSGNLVAYEKMMSTLSKLMTDGNIKPVQESGVSDDDACFGQFINKIENEEPIPEPLDSFKDIDGFKKYVTEWFVKPFARVFELDSDSEIGDDEDGN